MERCPVARMWRDRLWHVMQLPRAGKKLEETLVYLFQGGHGRVLLKSQERTWAATWDD